MKKHFSNISTLLMVLCNLDDISKVRMKLQKKVLAEIYWFSCTNYNTISFARILIARIEPLNDTPCLRNTSFRYFVHSSNIAFLRKKCALWSQIFCYRNNFTCVMMLYLSSLCIINIFLFRITHHHLKDYKLLS